MFRCLKHCELVFFFDKGQQEATLPCLTSERQIENKGCSFLAYRWKLPAYSGAFLLTVDNFSFFTYSWSFLTYNFSFFTYNWSFFAYSGKVRLMSVSTDREQRSSTVSKKAPTVSKKASPENKALGVSYSLTGFADTGRCKVRCCFAPTSVASPQPLKQNCDCFYVRGIIVCRSAKQSCMAEKSLRNGPYDDVMTQLRT